MKTYISLLRGINVSGQKLIKMDALKKMVEDLGFLHAIPYVQSGNVIFAARESNVNILENSLSKQIKKDFGFDVPVIVLPVEKLKNIIDHNPFLIDRNKDSSYMHVTFLSSIPGGFDPQLIIAKKTTREEIAFSDAAIYLYCPDGYGKTKLTNNFIETRLGVGATTRNWRTTNKLLNIAQEIGV
jgi:uncharacterized protein (DUF1697 family)